MKAGVGLFEDGGASVAPEMGREVFLDLGGLGVLPDQVAEGVGGPVGTPGMNLKNAIELPQERARSA